MRNTTSVLAYAFFLSFVLTLSHALLRSAAAHPLMELGWIIRVGASLILYAIVFGVYTLLLKHYNVSVLFPVYTALSIIGVSLTGFFVFGEEVTHIKILGILVISAGIFMISL